MDQTERIVYPQDRVFLDFSITISVILIGVIIIGFRDGILWIFFISSFVTSLSLYISRKNSAYSVTNYGIFGPGNLLKTSISWENIKMVDYQDPISFGLPKNGYPKLIIISTFDEPSIKLKINMYDREDILSLLDEIVNRTKNIVLSHKLKITMENKILPNEI